MSDHVDRGRLLRRRPTSTRVRAALSLGVVLGIGSTGTLAAWTDEATVSATTFTAGTMDLKINDVDAYTTTTLSMTATEPGNSSAEILTVKNAGTLPLKWTMTGGLIGTNAADFVNSGPLYLTVRSSGTKTGSGNSASCTTGPLLVNNVPLSTSLSTSLIGTPQGPLAAGATQPLCFQVSFSATAPSSMQGKTTNASFTLTGTSDLS